MAMMSLIVLLNFGQLQHNGSANCNF